MTKPFYNRENFDAQNSLGCLLRRAVNMMTPRAEARFVDRELSFSQWIALVCVRDGITKTCADIARHMNSDSGATTRLVDQLEERGLMTRCRSTTDRRVVHLSLTDKGKSVTDGLTPPLIEMWNDVLGEFSHGEAAMLIALLTRLVKRLEQTPVQPDTEVA